MDKLAQDALIQASGRLSDASAKMGAAHVAAQRAVRNGGPDFCEKIRTALEGVDNLAGNILEALGPVEELPAHEGVRKVMAHDDVAHAVAVVHQHIDPDKCPICVARKDTGAEETIHTDRPLHDRAGFGG